MNYTISIRRDEHVIAERSASSEMVVALLAAMLNNNPDLAAIVDNRVETHEVGRVRKTTWSSVSSKTGKKRPYKRRQPIDSEVAQDAARRHPATEQIEDMLIDGLTTAAIMEKVEVSAPTVGVIRARLRKEGRLVE